MCIYRCLDVRRSWANDCLFKLSPYEFEEANMCTGCPRERERTAQSVRERNSYGLRRWGPGEAERLWNYGRRFELRKEEPFSLQSESGFMCWPAGGCRRRRRRPFSPSLSLVVFPDNGNVAPIARLVLVMEQSHSPFCKVHRECEWEKDTQSCRCTKYS